MNKILGKIKNYFFKPINIDGDEFKMGKMSIKTITPKETSTFKQNCMTHGDRKRYFTNYNSDLLNIISEIKTKKS